METEAIFYEPMEALSGVFYDHINRWFFDYIHDDMDQETLNILRERAKQYENFIAGLQSRIYSQYKILGCK